MVNRGQNWYSILWKEESAMSIQQGIFSVKLHEMDKHYGKLQAHLAACQKTDRRLIREECRKLEKECRENEYILNQRIQGCRCGAVGKLSDIQLEYARKADHLLEYTMEEDMADLSDRMERKAEVKTLYAEYSIDFAMQTADRAMLAALQAIDAQMEYEEQLQKEKGR